MPSECVQNELKTGNAVLNKGKNKTTDVTDRSVIYYMTHPYTPS